MPRPQRPHRRTTPDGLDWKAALLCAGLLPWGQAQALPGDAIQFFVEENISRDSNIFRFAPGESALGTPGDTRMITTAGLAFDVPVSLQRFVGLASVSHDDYSRFDALDFTGRDLRATWHWQVDGSLSGQLGYENTRRLSSFSNFSGTTADPVTMQRAYGDAGWMVTPSWRLRAGLADQRYRHDVRQSEDIDLETVEASLSYVSPADNSIGIHWRQDDGAYPNNPANGFSQDNIGLATDWTVTEKSHLGARLNLTRRDFDSAARNDYSGVTYLVAYDLQATEKFSLTAELRRDFAPAEDVDTSVVLVKGIALRPRYELTDKMALSVNADYSSRDYVGAASGRKDQVRRLYAALSYRPLQTLTLTLYGQREERSSNAAFEDYTADMIGISARLSI